MLLKTAKEWDEQGFRIIKGEKSMYKDENGVALFTNGQVWDTTRHDDEYDDGFNYDANEYYDYDEFHGQESRYYGDLD